MSNDQHKDGTFDDLPPYERILREQAAAKAAAEKEAGEKAAVGRQWETQPMTLQRASTGQADAHPATLAEAAARRAEARQKAAHAAKARQAAQAAEREAQLAEEAARKVEEAARGLNKREEASDQNSGTPEAHSRQEQTTHHTKAHGGVEKSEKTTTRHKHDKHETAPATKATASGKRGSQAAGRHKHRRQFPWVAIVMLVCVAVVVLAVVQFGRNWVLPANADDTQMVEVDIPNGMVVSQMGDELEKDGIIRSSRAFNLYVRLTGSAGNLQAGVHRLSPSMTMGEVVSAMQEGASESGLLKVTVNEGLTVDQIADIVAESTSYSADDFLALMADDAFLSELVQQYPILTDSYNNPNVRYVLEGYLFPATYDFNEDDGLESLVTQMVDKTNEVLLTYQSQIDASSYSLQDIMSLASIVEKEGQTTEDRKLIAGVFYNRLNSGMPIQSDITVLYALGTHKEMVTYEDLEVDSPYNLYKNTGLPPGPVNSPSEDAIAAVLEPTASDYLYFYANIKTGEVFYTADYAQHQAWQQEYEETGDIQG